MGIIKYESENVMPVYVNGKPLYSINFKVMQWDDMRIVDKIDGETRYGNGWKFGVIIREAQKYINDRYKSLKDSLLYAINGNFYNMVRVKMGKRSIVQFRSIGWSLGKWNTFDNMYVSNVVDSTTVPVLKSFSIFMTNIKNKDGVMTTKIRRRDYVAGEDKHNDCIYHALSDAFNGDKTIFPEKIRTKRKFKRYFGYGRDDKMKLFEIVEELQTLLKVSIVIVGDQSYIPKEIKTRNIVLRCKGDHVTLQNNKGKERPIALFGNGTKENVVVYKVLDNDKIEIHEDKIKVLNRVEFNEYARRTRKLYILAEYNEDPKEVLEKHIRMTEHFKTVSNNIVNLYKCSYVPQMAIEIFRQLSKSIAAPEELEIYEHQPLNIANMGGVHHQKKGIFENCTDYDMNSMYLHIMSSRGFGVPMRKPETSHMTSEEINKSDFFPYGLYLCKIEGSSIWIPVKCENYMWMTHDMLKLAKDEKLKIVMSVDDVNVMLYKERVQGYHLFGGYNELVTKIRNESKGTEFESEAKLFSSCLWGKLCSKLKQTKILTEDEPIELKDYDIDELVPIEDNKYKMRYIDRVEIFKSPYARLGAFLTSRCRYELYKVCRDNGIIDDDIIVLNTDGMTLRNGKRLNDKLIGNKSGQFKICKGIDNSRCEVINCNNYFSV